MFIVIVHLLSLALQAFASTHSHTRPFLPPYSRALSFVSRHFSMATNQSFGYFIGRRIVCLKIVRISKECHFNWKQLLFTRLHDRVIMSQTWTHTFALFFLWLTIEIIILHFDFIPEIMSINQCSCEFLKKCLHAKRPRTTRTAGKEWH